MSIPAHIALKRGGNRAVHLFAPTRPTAEAGLVAPVTGPVWRLVMAAPPDVRLDEGAGTWCPLCDGLLAVGATGWACLAPSCRAVWDFEGRHGRWAGEDLAGLDELAARLAAEDAAQDAGALAGYRRTTCRTCRTWSDDLHDASGTHGALLAAEADDHAERTGEPVDDAELLAIAAALPGVLINNQLISDQVAAHACYGQRAWLAGLVGTAAGLVGVAGDETGHAIKHLGVRAVRDAALLPGVDPVRAVPEVLAVLMFCVAAGLVWHWLQHRDMPRRELSAGVRDGR
jgi:hypothetical protein